MSEKDEGGLLGKLLFGAAALGVAAIAAKQAADKKSDENELKRRELADELEAERDSAIRNSIDTSSDDEEVDEETYDTNNNETDTEENNGNDEWGDEDDEWNAAFSELDSEEESPTSVSEVSGNKAENDTEEETLLDEEMVQQQILQMRKEAEERRIQEEEKAHQQRLKLQIEAERRRIEEEEQNRKRRLQLEQEEVEKQIREQEEMRVRQNQIEKEAEIRRIQFEEEKKRQSIIKEERNILSQFLPNSMINSPLTNELLKIFSNSPAYQNRGFANYQSIEDLRSDIFFNLFPSTNKSMFWLPNHPNFSVKFQKAKKGFLPPINEKSVLCIFDDTLFGSFKSGWALTSDILYFKDIVNQGELPIESIHSLAASSNQLSLVINNNIKIGFGGSGIKGQELVNFFAYCISYLVINPEARQIHSK